MAKFVLKSVKWFDRLIRNYNMLLALFLGALMLPNVALLFTEPYSFVTAIISILFPLGVYIWILTIKNNIGKMMLFCFPIIFYCAFQTVIMKLFNGSFIAVDMVTNLFTTSASEAGELLSSLMPVIILVIVVYGGSILVAIHATRRGARGALVYRRRTRQFSAILLSTAFLLTVYQSLVNPLFSFREQIFPVNVIENTVIAFQREFKKNNYLETSKDFKFDAVKTQTDTLNREIYVLIIGETSRANNFSLNGYERNTNPRLSQLSNLVVAKDVITMSNTTHKIVPLLLAPTPILSFDSIYSQKSITTAFKEAGFDTFFISNQPPNGSFTDYFSKEAANQINMTTNSKNGVVLPDCQMLPYLRDAIENTDKNLFVVLHSYGSHFNYKARYPSDFGSFKDDDTSEISSELLGNLVNAFDNSIEYVDYFVSEVVKLVEAQNTTSSVVYLSDHGEDLYDDERGKFLHASPIPSYYQLHVPYVTWYSDSYKQLYPSKVDNLIENSKKPLSSEVLFHTLTDMASIQTPYLNLSLSIASDKFSVHDRYYINDRNQAVLFFNTGLSKGDFEMFDKHNIYYDINQVKQIKY